MHTRSTQPHNNRFSFRQETGCSYQKNSFTSRKHNSDIEQVGLACCRHEITLQLLGIWWVLYKLTESLSACVFTHRLCSGDEYLENQGIDASSWGLWRNHLALACMTLIFLTIAYLKLYFMKKFS